MLLKIIITINFELKRIIINFSMNLNGTGSAEDIDLEDETALRRLYFED